MTSWQPVTWIVMHTAANQYNEQYRDEYINFFEALKVIIPCSICRDHYNGTISKHQFSIHENVNSDKIFNWTVDLHNIVNMMHYKRLWSHQNARDFYTKYPFNNGVLKHFLIQYIRLNYRKNEEKTENLFKLMRSLAYIHPDENKRNQLIDFKNNFELNKDTIRNWLIAFLLILKGT